MIRPEQLRHKINFLQRYSGKNDYGEPNEVWTNIKTNIWASKEPLLGKEFYSALSTGLKVEVKFRTRFISGITSEMRIQHGSEVYEIIGPPINVKSQNRELLCYCRLVT